MVSRLFYFANPLRLSSGALGQRDRMLPGGTENSPAGSELRAPKAPVPGSSRELHTRSVAR